MKNLQYKDIITIGLILYYLTTIISVPYIFDLDTHPGILTGYIFNVISVVTLPFIITPFYDDPNENGHKWWMNKPFEKFLY